MSRSGWNRRWCQVAGVTLVGVLVGSLPAAAEPYPEQQRFDPAEFYDGLKKRGLTDLLALHLREHPPADDLDALLLARDIKLAEHADRSRPPDDRAAALAEANRLLEALAQGHPKDKRARQWRIDLAKSLLYEEAERFTSNILFRGGTGADRERLRPLMDRAERILTDLADRLQRRYDGLDDLSAAEYDRQEALGEITRLEQDIALVDYLLAWARFYGALSRAHDDPHRPDALRAVLEYLQDRSYLLNTPHAETHHQAQALLLAGMTDRRLGDAMSCRERLGRAVDVVAAVNDPDERHDLEWVATLARIELVRSLSDAGSFDAACQAIAVFRRHVEQSADDAWGRQLIVGLLDREVHRAQARRLESKGRTQEAAELRSRGVGALAALARADDHARDQVYATLYELLGSDAASETMSAFERGAYLAGALGEANDSTARLETLRTADAVANDPQFADTEARRARILDKAIDVGRSLFSSADDVSDELHAEAGFNLGVAYYQRGRRPEATDAFLQVAEKHPDFSRAQDAATFAVQLAWEMYQDASLSARTEIQELYGRALATLTTRYPDSDRARYWQFFRGQFLASVDRLDEAADAYDQVGPEHERFAEAVYLAAEARAELLKRFAAAHPDQIREINHRATSVLRSVEGAAENLERSVAAAPSATRAVELRRLKARAIVLGAEVCVIPRVARWQRALDMLDGFEAGHAEESDLIGRALRTRMIALESLGRVEEASQLIPRYVANDPGGAVPTLQGLFDALNEDIERDKRSGRTEDARERAASAVVIADGLYDVARQRKDTLGPGSVYAFRLQLAEATLEAADLARARVLFDECLAEDAATHPDGEPRDGRAMYGSAEVHYRLKEFDLALPLFNRVVRGGGPPDPLWWKALLRELQCRTELGGDPAGIVKVIQQRKFLDKEMGGPELRRQFDALLAANERRAAQDR